METLRRAIIFLLVATVTPRPFTDDILNTEDTFSINDINNTAVCILSKQVYHDGEVMDFPNPCEICRCRPPGIACATILCGHKELHPNCQFKKVPGVCCPQLICDEIAVTDGPKTSTESLVESTPQLESRQPPESQPLETTTLQSIIEATTTEENLNISIKDDNQTSNGSIKALDVANNTLDEPGSEYNSTYDISLNVSNLNYSKSENSSDETTEVLLNSTSTESSNLEKHGQPRSEDEQTTEIITSTSKDNDTLQVTEQESTTNINIEKLDDTNSTSLPSL